MDHRYYYHRHYYLPNAERADDNICFLRFHVDGFIPLCIMVIFFEVRENGIHRDDVSFDSEYMMQNIMVNYLSFNKHTHLPIFFALFD
jgi:hypothetical protein